jgi:hypothetical protein
LVALLVGGVSCALRIGEQIAQTVRPSFRPLTRRLCVGELRHRLNREFERGIGPLARRRC